MSEIIYYKSPLGVLCIQLDGEAICNLSFADTEKNAHAEKAVPVFSVPQSPALKACINQLDDYFSGRKLSFDLALKQPGTAFQQKVWNALINIRAGSTLSYLQLSKNIGDAKAIRAVGTANGRNNIAIIIPCHRVIGSDGTLVGYAGDLWRKQWLLEHEAKYCNGVQTLF